MKYLDTFFEEKDLPERDYIVMSKNRTENIIPSTAVIDAIKKTKGQEALQIANIIRQIDFANGNIHHFLEHLAQSLAVDI